MKMSNNAHLAFVVPTSGFDFNTIFGGRAELRWDEPRDVRIPCEGKTVLVLGLEHEIVRVAGAYLNRSKEYQRQHRQSKIV